MSDAPWTLERIETDEPGLAPLARIHRVLADETLRFATDGSGPAPRAAFAGPPAIQWLAGRPLLLAAHPAVVRDLTAPLTARLARRLAAEFPDVGEPALAVADAVEHPGFPWPERIAGFRNVPEQDEVPHAPLFQFLLLRALVAPATHLARSFSPPHPERWARVMCPFCGVKPAAAIAAPGSDRRLLCVLCGCRWTMQGLNCPTCGEGRTDRLRALASPEAGPASLEACDSCGFAVKVFSDAALTAGPPLAMEILTYRLDLVAERDEGVRRDPVALAAIFPPE